MYTAQEYNNQLRKAQEAAKLAKTELTNFLVKEIDTQLTTMASAIIFPENTKTLDSTHCYVVDIKSIIKKNNVDIAVGLYESTQEFVDKELRTAYEIALMLLADNVNYALLESIVNDIAEKYRSNGFTVKPLLSKTEPDIRGYSNHTPYVVEECKLVFFFELNNDNNMVA